MTGLTLAFMAALAGFGAVVFLAPPLTFEERAPGFLFLIAAAVLAVLAVRSWIAA